MSLIVYHGLGQEPPPGYELSTGKNISSIASAYFEYEFVSPVFSSTIKKELNSYFEEKGAHGYRYSFKGDLNPSFTGDEDIIIYSGPAKKGQLASLMIREKQSGRIMALFFRINKRFDMNGRSEIKLANLKFKEGSFFFDYCSAVKKYDLPYGMSDRISSGKKKYATDKVIDIKKFKVRMKKLNRILRKTNCLNK